MANPKSVPIDVNPELLLPELLAVHPECRPVFDRYGLHGCGGPLGPYETIRFFARTHGVDEARLLAELRQAIGAPAPEAQPENPSLADTIYRRYFLAGIALVLTAGATWGAWLLWKIALGGSFQSVSLNSVNAHGEAQIFGWMGLFIMGFAYQALPRMWHTTLVRPRLAALAFALAIAGLVGRTLGIATAPGWSLSLPLAMLGGVLQVSAVAIFAGQIVATFRRSGAALEAYIGFVLGALGWFVLSSVMSVWHTWNTLTARDPSELVWYVATYQAPLRDLQIHGLALFMILGVSLRLFPGLFDLPRIPESRAWWSLDLLTTAVFGETAIFLAYRWTGKRALLMAMPAAWLMIALAVALVLLPWKIWKPFRVHDRSTKFVRASYGWLAVSLAMLLISPLYHILGGIRFSHAYAGATRHVITVGFISLMIMGVAAKVVPNLNGIDTRTLTRLWGPFVLVNTGCLLRASGQILTDWWPPVYALLGASGTMEVAGLAWWGFGLATILWQGRKRAQEGPLSLPAPPARIGAEHVVAHVLQWFPQTESVFLKHGFAALKNPVLRRTLARSVTIRQAAAMRGVEPGLLVDALNSKLARSLPVLSDVPLCHTDNAQGGKS